MSTAKLSLVSAAILAQMVFVPTPGGQYDNGRGGGVVMPQVYLQPRVLPPQFDAPRMPAYQPPPIIYPNTGTGCLPSAYVRC